MWHDGKPSEITVDELLSRFEPGDILVLNDTKVLHRRVFAGDVEILFLESADRVNWSVLFPSKKFAIGDTLDLPGGVKAELVEKGRPQKLRTSQPLSEDYFERVGEMPLPPYIQKARGARHTVGSDEQWYQTAWAQKPGSFAAPTASLHFRQNELAELRERGVHVEMITLHVGLGTFLPVLTEDLNDHTMHAEEVEISQAVWEKVQNAPRVWALGTTVTRALESAALGKLAANPAGGFRGATDLLIQPGYDWKVVDRLMTNFHQPESTLLALVAAFAGLDEVKSAYAWAIERRFRLFSYGDLSVWT